MNNDHGFAVKKICQMINYVYKSNSGSIGLVLRTNAEPDLLQTLQ